MKLWKQRIIDTCPRCGMTTETLMHILTCPSAQSNATWEKSMITFADWLVSARTCPDIRDLLCHALQQWHDRLPVFPLHNYEFDGMLHIYEDQGRIGWQNLLFGFISVEWASVQDKYYKWLGVKRSGKRWVSMLIKNYGMLLGISGMIEMVLYIVLRWQMISVALHLSIQQFKQSVILAIKDCLYMFNVHFQGMFKNYCKLRFMKGSAGCS